MKVALQDSSVESLKKDRDRFVAFAFASADILLELDERMEIAFADGATLSLLGYATTELIQEPLSSIVSSEDTELLTKMFGPASTLKKIDNVKITLIGKTGQVVPFVISGYQMPYLKNHYFLTLSYLKADVTSEEIAQRDPHTGLLNREAFAWQALNQAKLITSPSQELYMSMIDISAMVEEVGKSDKHSAESMINDVCEFIKKCSVDGDSAGLIEDGRIGVIHTALVKTSDIENSIKTIAVNVDDLNDLSSCIKIETVKLDIPSLTESDSTKAVLYTLNRFTQNKNGEVSIKSLEESYRLMLGDTVNKFSEFKRICHEKNFEVAFQPIVALDNNEVHHYEALVRVEESNFRDTFHFITFGEQAGIIAEFDIAMCQKTFSLMSELESSKGLPMVSVNLSGISIANPLFQEALKGLLNRNEAVNGHILFEITESARIDDLVDSNRFIQELRGLGNKCCIDDFGAGESTFDYIRNLEVDFVKIDGSYVKEACSGDRGRHLLTSMVKVCQDLGMAAIAEMVEDREAAAFLRSLGVQMGQGYLFGKPTTDIKKLKVHHNPKYIKESGMSVKKLPNANRSWWAKK